MNYTFAVKVNEPIAVAVKYGGGRTYVCHVSFAFLSLGNVCVCLNLSVFSFAICLCCLVLFSVLGVFFLLDQ
jgi:hypothetical protein